MDPQANELPLRDIHAGFEPSWWPPAPGWWVLAALALVLLTYLAIRAYRRWRRWRFRCALEGEMEGLLSDFAASRNADRLAAEAATFLRRLIVHVGGHRQAASLTGAEWSRKLAEVSSAPQLTEICETLATAPYRQGSHIDDVQLRELMTLWVDRVTREARHV